MASSQSPLMTTLLLLSVHIGALVHSQESTPALYRETGTVVAIHMAERSYTTGVYTDAAGKTHGGNSIRVRKPVYRVETDSKFYELADRQREQFTLGQSIHFRIEKDRAYVIVGKKERRLRIVGIELKPPHQ